MNTGFDEQRLIRLEQQMEFLFRHLQLDPAMVPGALPLPPSYYDALRSHNLVAAINIYRKTTGASLSDSKKAVEQEARQGGY